MKNIHNKKCVLMLGFTLALTAAATTYAAQERNDVKGAEDQLLQEAISLCDQIEVTTPKGQLDVMRLRHNLNALQNLGKNEADSDEESPELVFSRSGANASAYSRRNKAKRVNFYNSCRGDKEESLRSKLHTEVCKMKGVDYGQARKILILDLDNRNGNVECVYTGRMIKVGTKNMPAPTTVNIEHTWPQSLGAVGQAKSDLHHLFVTDPKANSHRSSLPFGIVKEENPKYAVGGSKCDGSVFEVRPQHRGNVARAMFYFAVRYNKSIDAEEEKVLRQWHHEDPVDPCERARNDKIEAIQHNRNPFIDHPEYVDMIGNF